MVNRLITVFFLVCCVTTLAIASEQKTYAPAKVVYDVSSPDPMELNHILDRVSLLQNIYASDSFDASIIIIVHEGAIPFFAKSKQSKQPELIRRARSLGLGEIIQFRLCSASARVQGFTDKDFHDFITLVPMADAEIIQLQHDGYAYVR